ncbi:MAG: UDP-N-acetylmuramoyl-tripeptide--D-alanyl-D-alanine ligase [Clostridiales bacterium]|nr:UDP-N-acetylmuramoyl-tripeptide--D-alanyl-D-alanine ligase [Clostridiales bacterium]
MAEFTISEILKATGGTLKQFPVEGKPQSADEYIVDGISTDTRTIREGNAFLALIGENFDGNKYAVAAANDGAALLVLSTMEFAPEGVPVILVEDTTIALTKIAEYQRLRLGCKVVAVTGSVGKTSTREMIYSALSRGCKAYVTKANHNNEIGLSKTILDTPEDTDVLVLEMGMRLRGEISQLTHIAHPDVAVITNIGVAHIERLGSREEIMRAKLEVLECLKEGGLLVIPYADEYLQKAADEGLIREDIKIAYTSMEKVELQRPCYGAAFAGQPRINGDRISFTAEAGFGELQKIDLSIKVVGMHHVGNALAGLLCGLYFGIEPSKIAEGIASFEQIGHRERLVGVEGVYFLDDSYNAGPESMMAAFESVRRLAEHSKAYACISDMLELGDVAPEKHFEIGAKAASVGLDGVLVMGDFTKNVLEGVYSVSKDIPVYIFNDKEKMAEMLTKIAQKGDYVLLKASHSYEMYTILDSYNDLISKGIEA